MVSFASRLVGIHMRSCFCVLECLVSCLVVKRASGAKNERESPVCDLTTSDTGDTLAKACGCAVDDASYAYGVSYVPL